MDQVDLLKWILGGVGAGFSALVTAIIVLWSRREIDHRDRYEELSKRYDNLNTAYRELQDQHVDYIKSHPDTED